MLMYIEMPESSQSSPSIGGNEGPQCERAEWRVACPEVFGYLIMVFETPMLLRLYSLFLERIFDSSKLQVVSVTIAPTGSGLVENKIFHFTISTISNSSPASDSDSCIETSPFVCDDISQSLFLITA